MHPAVRVFLVALVIVLVCSHLILNMLPSTDKPASVVSRRLTSGSMRHPDVRKSNGHWNGELMDRIGDMTKREVLVGKASDVSDDAERREGKVKIPVEVQVEKAMMRQETDGDDDGRKVQGEVVDSTERLDEGEDCEGNDGQGNDDDASSD